MIDDLRRLLWTSVFVLFRVQEGGAYARPNAGRYQDVLAGRNDGQYEFRVLARCRQVANVRVLVYRRVLPCIPLVLLTPLFFYVIVTRYLAHEAMSWWFLRCVVCLAMVRRRVRRTAPFLGKRDVLTRRVRRGAVKRGAIETREAALVVMVGALVWEVVLPRVLVRAGARRDVQGGCQFVRYQSL